MEEQDTVVEILPQVFPQSPVICGARITLIKDSAFVFSNNGFIFFSSEFV